jgi:hypothetical protein
LTERHKRFSSAAGNWPWLMPFLRQPLLGLAASAGCFRTAFAMDNRHFKKTPNINNELLDAGSVTQEEKK